MKVIELPKFMWYRNFNGFSAYNYIFIKAGMRKSLKSYVIMHEYKHCLDWNKEGFFRFIYNYIKETKNKGYWNNKYEIAARLYGAENKYKYREVLDGKSK